MFLKPKKNIDRPDRLQEKRLAKRFSGFQTPRSGAGNIKGDVQTTGVYKELIEAKTTSKTQYVLRLDDLYKLEYQAKNASKHPVFTVELRGNFPKPILNREWVIIPLEDYERLRNSYVETKS